MEKTNRPQALHLFLDEAGDTTFYGKKRKVIVGQEGVSKWFLLGMVHFEQPLLVVRQSVLDLQKQIENDPYYLDIQSVGKRKAAGGYFIHAKDDVPEIRKLVYEFIKNLPCRFEAVAFKKNPQQFEAVHNAQEGVFYSDVLSHLVKNHLDASEKIVLNIAQRGTSTKNVHLENSLRLAKSRHSTSTGVSVEPDIRFNVQTPANEPLINIADYFCWAVQRRLERDEARFENFIREKIGRLELVEATT